MSSNLSLLDILHAAVHSSVRSPDNSHLWTRCQQHNHQLRKNAYRQWKRSIIFCCTNDTSIREQSHMKHWWLNCLTVWIVQKGVMDISLLQYTFSIYILSKSHGCCFLSIKLRHLILHNSCSAFEIQSNCPGSLWSYVLSVCQMSLPAFFFLN